MAQPAWDRFHQLILAWACDVCRQRPTTPNVTAYGSVARADRRLVKATFCRSWPWLARTRTRTDVVVGTEGDPLLGRPAGLVGDRLGVVIKGAAGHRRRKRRRSDPGKLRSDPAPSRIRRSPGACSSPGDWWGKDNGPLPGLPCRGRTGRLPLLPLSPIAL